jgi:hypothetical protein
VVVDIDPAEGKLTDEYCDEPILLKDDSDFED